MKKLEGIAKRITAMLLSSMLVIGLVSGSIFASEIEVDTGQTSEIAVDDDPSEENDLSMDEDIADESSDQTDDSGTGEGVDETVSPDQKDALPDQETDDSEEIEQDDIGNDSDVSMGNAGTDPDLVESTDMPEETDSTEASLGVVASGVCGDHLTWTVDQEGTLVISGTGAMKDYRIGYPLYSPVNEIKTIIIENGVTSIGENAFYWFTGLTDITIPNSVRSIGNDAFYNCNSLTSITLPNGVTTIGNEVFKSCKSLTSIILPDSLNSIGNATFSGCSSLTSIILPNSLTSIGTGTFYECSMLTSITFPENVSSIGACMFYHCYKLENITIPDCVNSIGSSAFEGIYRLTSITIPDNVNSIGKDAFSGCDKLTIYANSGSYAAIYAGNNGIPLIILNPKEVSGTCGDQGDNLAWLLDDKGVLTISGSGGMKDYDDKSPWYDLHRNEIKTVIINNGVTNIGDRAFYGCNNLTSITIPDSVASIGISSFSGCGNLSSITLPVGLSDIGWYAFSGCNSLTSLTVPSSVTSIEGWAFEACRNLGTIYFTGNAPFLHSEIFLNVIATVYYPKNDSTWTDTIKQNYGGRITWISWGSNDNEYFAPVESVPIKNGIFQFRSLLKNDDTIEYLFDYDDAWVFSNKSSDRYNLLKTAIRVSMAAFGAKGSDNDYGSENIKKMMDTMGYKYTETSIAYEKPTYDSIGSAIGLKNIINSDGSESSIILVALRGGGYGIEWGGDFRVGSPDYSDHEGFRKAADTVKERLKKFVEENKSYLNSDIKVWITGFSRAAATSNLVAADLINSKYTINGISPDDVIAFCFECPQNTLYANTNSVGKKNIINVVNPIDFVPKVAFKTWGFSRYGTTYYIPSKETTSLYNINYKYQMIWKYQDLCDYNDGVNLTDDQVVEILGQASFLDRYFDFLSTFINRKEYYNKHEDHFMEIAAGCLGGGSTPDWGDAVPTLLRFLKVTILQPFTTGEVIGMFRKGNSGPGPVAHYPELCMSWIDSLNGFSNYKTNENSWYRTVLVNCPVDVTVKDNSGKIVGQIVENEVKAVEDGIVVRLDENGQKSFVLPQDAEYTIEIQATDTGKLNYTIKEYNFDTSSTDKVTIYKDIDITKGEEIIGTINTGNSVGDADYTLKYKDEEKLLKPDEELTGDDIKRFTVEAISSGNGEVIGGGFYINGEFAKLSAKADEGYEFVGWYRSNKCISTETEYRFPVTENVIINAVFVPEQVEIIDKGSCGESATWKFEKNGQLTISGKGAVEDYFMDNIPHAPWLGKNVKKVVVGEGITRIGNYSFYHMRSLTEVVLPKTLKEIGWGAFQECSSLSKVNIPTGVEFIDGIAFDSTSWLAEKRKQNAYVVINGILIDGRSVKGDEINIPRDVKIIGPGSFSDKNFKHVIIPEGVELISSFAFNNDWANDGLQSLVIPVSIKKIDEWAFRGRSVKEVKYGGPPSKWKQFNISKDYNKELWYTDISFTYNAISEATVSGINNKTYTGKPIVQNVKVKAGSESLKEKIDYYVSYSNNTDVGTATISIVGCGDYTGTRIETFEINPATQIFDVKTTATSLEVGKKATVSTTGAKGKLSYKSSNTAIAAVNASSGIVTAKRVGTVTITASSAATANYKQASKTINITIVPATQIINVKTTATSLAVGKKATVSTTGAKGKITYKSSNTAVATVDATTGVVTAKKIGMATITASSAATADYKQASKTVKITIVPAATSSLTASNLTTGIKLKWKKVVGAKGYYVYRGTKLIKTINAASSVSYTDKKANANGVKYTYKIVAKASTGKGAAKTLVIYRISQPSISSVKNSGSRKMAVKWSKNAKASGYQMQYSPQKLFKTGNKTVTLTSAGTVSKTVGSLTKGKTYYVRIRTYKTIGGKKYYSTWSATKALKISK